MRARGLAEPAIENYLVTVAARLIGPRHTRAAILDELRDGLQTAAAAHRGRGMSRHAAVTATLDEFGDPITVARAFAGELASAHARHVSLAYLLTGPLVGVFWLTLLAPPGWWQDGPATLASSIPALPLVVFGGGAAVLVLAGTGRLSRRLHPRPRHLLDVTMVLGLACMAGDLLMLTVLAHTALPPFATPGPLAVIAATASLTRLACTVASLDYSRRVRIAVAS